MRARRGFTMVEVMLAAVLGTMVVVTALTLFASIANTQRRTGARDFGLQELSRLNLVMRRALSLIVVEGLVRKRPGETGPATAKPVESPEVGALEGGGDNPDDTEAAHPRVVLEADGASGGQRLELVLAEPPVLGGADGAILEADTGRRFSKTRGAFELRLSDGTLPREVLPLVRADVPVYDLWWAPVDHQEEGVAVVGRAQGVLVARGLTVCRWRFFKTDESNTLQSLTEANATARSELPAYFEMDVETLQGQKARWMFEVGWTVEQPARATGATGATGTTGSTGTTGATGASGSTGQPGATGTPAKPGRTSVRGFASPDGDHPAHE